MGKSSASLREITEYFDYWREVKDECMNKTELLKVFAALAKSHEEYKSIPVSVFSQSLKMVFDNENVEYQLSNTQEKNILDRLATLTAQGKLKEENFVSIFQYWTRKCISPLKALVIIDVQNDFISGSLRLDRCPAKDNGEDVVPVINQLIGGGCFDILAYTYDWHPSDHCSYLSNIKHHSASVHSSVNIENLKLLDVITLVKPFELKQTMWPDHCLQNSWGAELHNDLRKPDIDKDILVYKGVSSDIDSYSAFFDNGRSQQTDLFLKLLKRGVTDVYVVGLAFDFCVGYSALDAAYLSFDTFVIEDACRGVDLKSKNEMKKKFAENNIALLQVSDIIKT